MATKTKRKTKKTKVSKAVPKPRARTHKKYESHYLALILIGFLLLQGVLMTSTTATDWKAGTQILDVSSAVSSVSSDVADVFSPVVNTFDSVNQFYVQAATAMIPLLDLSSDNPVNDVVTVASSVNDFYQQAATQMASVLDLSSISSWPARVAGVAIMRQ